MEEKLIQRLESAVARLEALSAATVGSREIGDGAPADPAIVAFDDFTEQYVARVSAAAEKIGGQVAEVTKVLREAFAALKELLVKVKQTQVGDSRALSIFFCVLGFGFLSLLFIDGFGLEGCEMIGY